MEKRTVAIKMRGAGRKDKDITLYVFPANVRLITGKNIIDVNLKTDAVKTFTKEQMLLV